MDNEKFVKCEIVWLKWQQQDRKFVFKEFTFCLERNQIGTKTLYLKLDSKMDDSAIKSAEILSFQKDKVWNTGSKKMKWAIYSIYRKLAFQTYTT